MLTHCGEELGILTYNGQMFSLPHFHFLFKYANISTILTSKLKTCVESSVNKQIRLNCVLFLHRVRAENTFKLDESKVHELGLYQRRFQALYP